MSATSDGPSPTDGPGLTDGATPTDGDGRAGYDRATRRADLQRAAFGRYATPADAAALAEFERQTEHEPTPQPVELERPPDEYDTAVASDSDTRGPVARAPRQRLLLIGAVLTLLLLSASTVVLSVRLAASESLVAGSAPSQGADPLDRLSGPQRIGDIPDATLPNDYDPASVRRLLDPEQTVLTDDYELFGARDDDGRVCLIVAFPDHHVAASCVTLAELRRDGIRIATNVYRSSRASLGSDVLVSHTVTWLPDDTFEFTSSLADDGS